MQGSGGRFKQVADAEHSLVSSRSERARSAVIIPAPSPAVGSSRSPALRIDVLFMSGKTLRGMRRSVPTGRDGSDRENANAIRLGSRPLVRWADYHSCHPQRRHLCALAQRVELVRPPLHHADTLLPELSPGIGPAHSVPVLMGKLAFDRVRMPKPAFV